MPWHMLSMGVVIGHSRDLLSIYCRFTVPNNREKPGNQFKNSNHSKMADVLLEKGKLKP